MVDVVLSRDLICMNSDMMVDCIERYSVEEPSETLQAWMGDGGYSLPCSWQTV